MVLLFRDKIVNVKFEKIDRQILYDKSHPKVCKLSPLWPHGNTFVRRQKFLSSLCIVVFVLFCV